MADDTGFRYVVQVAYGYTVLSKEFYESLSRYAHDPAHFIDLIHKIVPREWQCRRHDIWYSCGPPGHRLPDQGWKIHVSSTLENSAEVLSAVAAATVRRGIAFKCALDRFILSLLNGKRWPRGGCGKFITIYPRTDLEFKEIIDECYGSLAGFTGPYILTDRRYRDSKVLYYRYGGFTRSDGKTIRGEQMHPLVLPTGEVVADRRRPFVEKIDGVPDPFADEEEADHETAEVTLKNGRYVVESAVSFSSAGGAYIGRDTVTNTRVLIKEARPYVLFGDGDVVSLLKKEFRFISRVADLDVAPRPIDFFQEWEHTFLVQEHLDGMNLRAFMNSQMLSLYTNPNRDQANRFFDVFCKTYRRIAEALALLHARGITFGDLSHNNVMVLDGSEEIRLVDFEGAHEKGVRDVGLVITPGFARRSLLEAEPPTASDDLYSLGSVMIAGMMPINSLLALDERLAETHVKAWEHDLSLPRPIADVILQLRKSDPGAQATIEDAIRALSKSYDVPTPLLTDETVDERELRSVVAGVVDYLYAKMDYERTDCLAPADPSVFETNPVSIAWGASGMAYALHRMKAEVSPRVVEWSLARLKEQRDLPAGLYVGRAGVAWTLLELGHESQSIELMQQPVEEGAFDDCPDLFYGSSGWGMTQLRFWLHTGDSEYLKRARRVGDTLLTSCQYDDAMPWWPSLGDNCCGLAHGTSGVCLFLLYLYKATDDARYLTKGLRGLDYVLSRARRQRDGMLTWPVFEGDAAVTPYWRWGTAGIAMVLLRYYHVTHDPKLLLILDAMIGDCIRKYTIFPGRFFGLAGLGEFLLDLELFNYRGLRELVRKRVSRIISGLLLFKLQRPDGIAFPGDTLLRVSCDFGTGSAGIGVFLTRYLDGGAAPYMLDELLGVASSMQSWSVSEGSEFASTI